MLIDDNKDYVKKSKLTITVKTPSEYNERSRVAAKQTNRLRDTENWQTSRQRNKGTYYLQIDAQADVHVNTSTETCKQKWKMRSYVLL